MKFNKGQRVCSKIRGSYYRTPGTCLGLAQFQITDLPGLDYSIELDDGRRVVLNEVELDEVTDEDEVNYCSHRKQIDEYNNRVKERVEKKAKGRAEYERQRRQRIQEQGEEKLDQKAKEQQEHDEEMRKEMAPIYGANSLRKTR